jgi:hypothetical protein
MAHKWKFGDRAMVTVDFHNLNSNLVKLDSRSCGSDWILPVEALAPLPPLITPEAQAVLDAAVAWMDVPHSLNGDMPLLHVARTYRASITPPDPIAELIAQAKEAVGQLIRNDCHTGGSLLSEAIAAVEAIRKPKV